MIVTERQQQPEQQEQQCASVGIQKPLRTLNPDMSNRAVCLPPVGRTGEGVYQVYMLTLMLMLTTADRARLAGRRVKSLELCQGHC